MKKLDPDPQKEMRIRIRNPAWPVRQILDEIPISYQNRTPVSFQSHILDPIRSLFVEHIRKMMYSEH